MTVVSLHGGPVADTREPCPPLVEEIERILEMARSGEIQGASLAFVFADGSSSWATAGLFRSHSLVGALEVAKSGIIAELSR